MKTQLLNFLLLFSASIYAADFNLHQGATGSDRVVITMNDSLEDFDISDVSIEGYTLENAILIQDNDVNMPLKLKPGVIDIGQSRDLKTLRFSRQDHVVEVEGPLDFVWQPGMIVVDTSHQGFSQKILTVTESGYYSNRRVWTLTVEPVSLVEIVEQCDISFISQPRIVYSRPDTHWVESIVGREGALLSSNWTEAQLEVQLENFGVQMKPRLSGRLRVVRGAIETNTISLSGVYEITSNVTTKLSKAGVYHFNLNFPEKIHHTISLDSGVVLSFSQGMSVNISLDSRGSDFRSYSEFNVLQEFRSQMKYTGKTWMLVSNEMNITPVNNSSTLDPSKFFGAGTINIGVVPHSGVNWNGENGVQFNIRSYSQVVQDSSQWAPSNRTLMNGLMLNAEGVGSFEPETPLQKPIEFGKVEKQLGAPPLIELNASLTDASSETLIFGWDHDVSVERYLVETKVEGSWVRTDSLLIPPLQVTGLNQLTEYEFRIIPINNRGAGLPKVITGTTLRQNLPPELPVVQYPLMGDTVGSLNVHFSWLTEDPDSVEALKYILLLDTLENPERAVLNYGSQRAFEMEILQPGKTYYWRIKVVDGKHQVLGPVWQFFVSPEKSVVTGSEKVITYPKAVRIEPGEYLRSDSKQVKVGGFYLQKYEVTQKDFKAVMGYNPSYWKGDHLPVESINWNEANKYCKEIGGRLPTESEWEYAARSGTRSAYYWKNHKPADYAWYFANSGKRTQLVGKKKPNAFGLYDMSGNVFEWVSDWHGKYKADKLVNPKGSREGSKKVTRGGSWYSDASSLKSSRRFMNRPGFSSFKLGMRCAFSDTDQ